MGSASPTVSPSAGPTAVATGSPSAAPTPIVTQPFVVDDDVSTVIPPTPPPTAAPTVVATSNPTTATSPAPTSAFTSVPTFAPTPEPTRCDIPAVCASGIYDLATGACVVCQPGEAYHLKTKRCIALPCGNKGRKRRLAQLVAPAVELATGSKVAEAAAAEFHAGSGVKVQIMGAA